MAGCGLSEDTFFSSFFYNYGSSWETPSSQKGRLRLLRESEEFLIQLALLYRGLRARRPALGSAPRSEQRNGVVGEREIIPSIDFFFQCGMNFKIEYRNRREMHTVRGKCREMQWKLYSGRKHSHGSARMCRFRSGPQHRFQERRLYAPEGLPGSSLPFQLSGLSRAQRLTPNGSWFLRRKRKTQRQYFESHLRSRQSCSGEAWAKFQRARLIHDFT
ncbi:hypothetical protein TREES_T100003186 [Tupaia chinensis]|uniref:Uncharacterized protein n=1 Tax=Tupaia chinensis TaxID=246437 RepID=L9KFH9_TUPCH|nr:hypothetical protein TREES_T100003186 [Tupaia chinensis]